MNFMKPTLDGKQVARKLMPLFARRGSPKSSPAKSQNSLVSQSSCPPALHKQESAPTVLENNYQLTQKCRHEAGDHLFRHVILFVVVAIIVIFAVDVYKEMVVEKNEHEIRRRRCYNEYVQNECESPVDAMRQNCHQLEVCFSTRAEEAVRMSISAAKVISKITKVILTETSTFGALLTILILAFLLIFTYKYGKTVSIQETTLKKS